MRIQWQVRKTPRALFKQYRRYGRGKAAMVLKNGVSSVRARYLAAPTAVSGSVVLLIAACWYYAALFGVAPYIIALCCASVCAWRRRDREDVVSAATIPAAFLAMHAGWGLGFLEGLILKRNPALASGSAVSGVKPSAGAAA